MSPREAGETVMHAEIKAPDTRRINFARLASMREAGLIVIILALCIAMSFASPHFLTWGNFRAMLMSFSIEGIVVVGMTILLIVGGIDLSVGSVVCFSMVVSGALFLAGLDPWTASLIGIGVSALVAGLKPGRSYDVEVIPATGLVQGKHYTDVNHVASLMADKLGGRAYQVHAPLFADTPEQREMLMGVRSVADVFRKAREADVAVVGIGSILTDDSSYYDLHPSSSADRQAIQQSGASGELLAHLIDSRGKLCGYALNRSLVSLTLDEFATIPRSIGIASGPSKAAPILSAMRGNHLDTIVTDEATSLQILDLAEQEAA